MENEKAEVFKRFPKANGWLGFCHHNPWLMVKIYPSVNIFVNSKISKYSTNISYCIITYVIAYVIITLEFSITNILYYYYYFNT